MSAELEERRAQVEKRMALLLRAIDPTMRELYQTLLAKDAEEGLDEERKVSRLEGFHDYIVVREATGHEHPSIDAFISVRKNSPESLISFGTGKRRVPLEGDDDPVDDTVADSDLDGEDVLEAEIEAYEDEGGNLPPVVISADSASSPDEADEEDKDNEEDEDIESETLDTVEAISENNDEEAEDNDAVKEVVEDEKVVEPVEEKEGSTPGRINAEAITSKRFSEKRGGYNKDLVDDFLDEVLPYFTEKKRSDEEYDSVIDRLKNPSLKGAALRVGFNTQEVDGYISAMISEIENRKSEQ